MANCALISIYNTKLNCKQPMSVIEQKDDIDV